MSFPNIFGKMIQHLISRDSFVNFPLMWGNLYRYIKHLKRASLAGGYTCIVLQYSKSSSVNVKIKVAYYPLNI